MTTTDNQQETLRILQAARELIGSKGSWTQGCLAKDSNGIPTSPRSADACYFCLEGALSRAVFDVTGVADNDHCSVRVGYEADWVLRQLVGGDDGRALFYWNDDSRRSYSDVLSALDRAIASLQSDSSAAG